MTKNNDCCVVMVAIISWLLLTDYILYENIKIKKHIDIVNNNLINLNYGLFNEINNKTDILRNDIKMIRHNIEIIRHNILNETSLKIK